MIEVFKTALAASTGVVVLVGLGLVWFVILKKEKVSLCRISTRNC